MFVVYFGENMPLFVEKIHFENSKFIYMVVGFHTDTIHAQEMV